MKIKYKYCGDTVDSRGYGTHVAAHERRGDKAIGRPAAKQTNKKQPEAKYQSSNPVDILVELERQTKQAVKNLQTTRNSLIEQTMQIEDILKKYDVKLEERPPHKHSS